MLRLAIPAVLAIVLSGCGPHRALPAASNDPGRLDRARAAASRLVAAVTLDVGLADRSGTGAWAWPDGRVRLTPRLIDALDDDELAAVLAHEAGHILGSAPAPGPAAVGGEHAAPAVEIAADAAGCAILAASGIPATAMLGVLDHLAATGLDVRARRAAAARACR